MKITFPARLSWENFHTVMLKGLKVYAFYLAVLSLFRLCFIVYLHDYLGPASWRCSMPPASRSTGSSA